MNREPHDPQFDELRQLLELKRYERPPTEFRCDFMAEFRQRRLGEDQRRAAWYIRLWQWLVPDYWGTARNAAIGVIALLLVANVLVIRRNGAPRLPQTVSISAPVATATRDDVATDSATNTGETLTSQDFSTELDYAETYLLLADFYEQAQSIMDESDRENAFLTPHTIPVEYFTADDL